MVIVVEFIVTVVVVCDLQVGQKVNRLLVSQQIVLNCELVKLVFVRLQRKALILHCVTKMSLLCLAITLTYVN